MVAGPIDVSPALNTKGGSQRTDFEVDALLAFHGAQVTFPQNTGGVFEDVTPTMNEDPRMMVAFAQNQREEVRDLGDLAGAIPAEPGTHQQTMVINTNDQNSAGNRIQFNADVSVTLQGEGGGMGAKTGMYALPVGVRRLTPTECERLQGFPDGWTDAQSDSARYRQLGNAVTVNVIEWLGRRIMEAA